MTKIKMDNVTKRFDDKLVLDNINIDIADKELVVFVGPSGCGKSTAMRCVAGLEEVTSGKIFIGEKLVNVVPAKDRDIAFIFQNYALYPHMSVYDNIAFGLRARKVLIDVDDPKAKPRKFRKEEIDEKVKNAVKILKIEDLLKRKPNELSGGQQQRVAMGRAIVRQPKVFLMDEPLSNLDAKLRAHMRTELKRLQIELGVTTIYVTHDQAEAMTLGDRIACMHEGVFQQIGTPEEVYNSPVNKFVAGFIGSPSMNFVEGKINGSKFETSSFVLQIPEKMITKIEQSTSDKNKIILGIRPEDIEDKEFALSVDEDRIVSTKVIVRENYGSDIFLSVEIKDTSFNARVNTATKARVHENIDLVFNLERAHFFNGETEENLTI
ncbi:MAG: Trehalose/maltose import ATP-binding protein MalK [Candidatus Heimdallarchaeota archaeon LC_3]|nr:MAG: Trehalose/maltose import ATP-binding protein MalK [Candidatus Heimdallarchaeota archaeon LC_3]